MLVAASNSREELDRTVGHLFAKIAKNHAINHDVLARVSGGTDVRFNASAILFGVILTLAPPFGGVVQAQMNLFRGLGPRLTDDDVQLLLNSTARLNQAVAPKPGQSDDWNNPKTGAHGSTTLTKIYRYQDMECHTLRYEVSPNSTRPLRTYTVDWCETPGGEWKARS